MTRLWNSLSGSMQGALSVLGFFAVMALLLPWLMRFLNWYYPWVLQ